MGGLPALLGDVRAYLLRRPEISTFVRWASDEERKELDARILQRLDVSVAEYAILNIHRIGVKAPVGFVFDRFRTWGPDSRWWPNRIAEVEPADHGRQHIRVFLLGRRTHPFGIETSFFGLNVIPLFDMEAIRIVEHPTAQEPDNARYMLYRCGGGYPIGVVVIYVRSSIAERDESDETQLFFAVGFNFYGRVDWPRRHVVNTVWERVHNRVTSNVLNRFKVECEASFAQSLADSRS